jgi:hypothetical protein
MIRKNKTYGMFSSHELRAYSSTNRLAFTVFFCTLCLCFFLLSLLCPVRCVASPDETCKIAYCLLLATLGHGFELLEQWLPVL